jgi:hypothetical protein
MLSLSGRPNAFLPAFVRTYNAGLSFALLSSCSCGHINQNSALFSNFTMLSAYCTIALQPCPAALPGSLARQLCPAALQKHCQLNNRP